MNIAEEIPTPIHTCDGIELKNRENISKKKKKSLKILSVCACVCDI